MFKSLFKKADHRKEETANYGVSPNERIAADDPNLRKLAKLYPERAALDPIEIASRDEIAALQRKRLAATLELAYEKVPHYKAAFDAKGVHPSDFKHLEDLRNFPFTTKADLRANYPFGMFAVPREQVARIHASSGTTGKPTVVGYTRADIDIWSEVMARSIRASGGRPGMTVHVAYGYGLFTGGLGAHYGAERLGCTVIPMSGGMTERQVQLIVDFKPDIIMVTPSYMLAILDEFRRVGIDPGRTALKVGIFGAEPWTNAMRAEIEEAFDIHAVDIYGLSEVIGPGVANECVETKDGLHIWEDHFYPEIIDPETGEVLPDGAFGELVFTSLTKQAMPVIRYRTRDLTRLLPGTARSMRRMEKVTGRSDDMLVIRGVNIFPTQVEERLLAIPSLSGHYQIVVTRPDRLDEVEVKVEMRESVNGHSDREKAKAALQHSIREAIGVSVTVSVLDPGEVERSVGKAKRVVDMRPPT
jgi:phenylacetate-CoA ligase